MTYFSYVKPMNVNFGKDAADLFEGLMDNLFETSLDDMPDPAKPLVDIEETDSSFIICAELAGVPKEDVSIEIEKNVLTISGKRESEDEDRIFHIKETGRGAFSRSFKLPESVDLNGITAEQSNGILKLKLPKMPETKQRKIEIA